uniref:folate gamma-glutamyl hydrolase n=1 Tax=Neogobius melanostomus TaxID=47308 RepID=A0A8C6TEE3_9GOBI
MCLLLCLMALTLPCLDAATRNYQPVIGILAQEVLRGATPNASSYIASSYVKALESAGARVIPVNIYNTEAEYKALFNSLNGILFPGGDVSITTSGYARAARIFYDLAIEANKKGDYFPVWGTCLGFEQLGVLTANVKEMEEILVRTNLTKVSVPLNFTQEANGSRLFRDFSDEMMEILATEPLTVNAHIWSISMETYHSNERLNKFYRVLSTNNDGPLEFISTFEAIDYPMYGVQWHPEKSPFEWNRDYYPHTANAVRVSFHFAEFFVSEARKSSHYFESEQAVRDLLIYHHHPTYTGDTYSVFEQKYFFGNGTSEPPKADPQVSCATGGAVRLLAQANALLATALFLFVVFSAD